MHFRWHVRAGAGKWHLTKEGGGIFGEGSGEPRRSGFDDFEAGEDACQSLLDGRFLGWWRNSSRQLE